MAVKIIDPFDEPHFPAAAEPERPPLKGEPASVIANAKPRQRTPKRDLKASTTHAKNADPYKRQEYLLHDFRQFLALVWEFLGLPEPSAVQLALAWWLQHGPERAIILGFRGMAKSWITGAYILWTLYCDPQKKILVVSANLDRAVQTVQWCLALIREMPELRWLEPGPLQRSSAKAFDVGPARPDQSPSLRGAGITGQVTGSRAHLIVPDDVEIPSNSMTTLMREKISEAVKEFDAILHPGGEVKFLGTPQVDDSLYVKLQARGYTCRIWPARYPDKKMRLKYGDRLSPWVVQMVDSDPTLVGHSVWPSRFSDEDLENRELSYGRSGFALQFMLDTSLADADRYPLKLRDLIVDAIDREMGPETISWGNDPQKVANDLPLMGFEGDRLYLPAAKSERYSPYTQIKASLDISGRGSNQTALTVVAELNARLFLLCCRGWMDGYSEATLKAIAASCIEFKVQVLTVEDNFGDGMFSALFAPVLEKAWREHNAGKQEALRGGTELVSIKSPKTQKELRILSVLEPCTQQHRLVVSPQVIEEDQKDIRSMVDAIGQDAVHHYSLFHQYSHLSREKDSLLQDDKVESLAMACAQYADILNINPWEMATRKEEELIEQELEELFADADDVAHRTPVGAQSWDRTKHPIRPPRRH